VHVGHIPALGQPGVFSLEVRQQCLGDIFAFDRPTKPAQAATIKVPRIVQHTPKGRAWKLPEPDGPSGGQGAGCGVLVADDPTEVALSSWDFRLRELADQLVFRKPAML
jgi:hypothetical protein